MGDSRKTKKELIEELKALREKVDTGGQDSSTTAGDEDSGGLTRRDILTGWVAPVILTVPLASRPVYAQRAQGDVAGEISPSFFTVEPSPYGPEPTRSPTVYQAPPTLQPTNSPTKQPTNSPTNKPTTQQPTRSPTNRPTSRPTSKPTSSPTASPTTAAPTAFPTVAPTTVIPVELSEFEID